MLVSVAVFALAMAAVWGARILSTYCVSGTIGDRVVLTYGFFQAGGHIAGLAVFLTMTPPEFQKLFLFLICVVYYPAAAVGSRVVCGMTDYWQSFRTDPVDFVVRADRYSAFGGLIGGSLAYGASVVFFDVPFALWTVDAFCLGFVSGEVISRLGCHANGCCYGKPIGKAMGLARLLSVSYVHKFQKAVWHGELYGKPIYAAAWCQALLNLTLLFLLVLIVAQGSAVQAGFAGGLGLMLYPYCRLINEMLRSDRNGMGKTLTYIVLLVLFLAGAISFLSSFGVPKTAHSFSIDILREPSVVGTLALEYVLLLLVYGVGSEFRKNGLVLQPEIVRSDVQGTFSD